MIKKFWLSVRPPHRILQYGTVCLPCFDDRTRAERLCDRIDAVLNDLERRLNPKHIRRQIWHTFYDIGIGGYISSYAEIKRIEKEKGWMYIDKNEIEREAAKYARYNDERESRMIHKGMDSIMRDIGNGRSFVKEAHDRIKRGEYEVGKRKAFNG